jgi:hypothetical protein
MPDGLAGAAEWYARELGWRVIPLHRPTATGCSCGKLQCASPGKHPILDDWVNAASCDPDVVAGWWRRWPNANIGLATGDVTVFYLDAKPEADGRESWRALQIDDSGALRDLTGRGEHLFFSANGHKIGNRTDLLPGVDFRGEGGMVVLPPSLHANKQRYAWEVSAHPEDKDPGPVPAALLALLNGKTGDKPTGKRAGSGSFELPPRILEGARDDVLFRYASSLRAKNKTEAEILEALRVANERCEPPMDDATLVAKAKSAGRYEPGREQPKTADYIAAAETLGYRFRLNDLNDELEVNGAPMTDAMRATIRGEMRDAGFWRTNVAEDAFLASGAANRYHPVRDYLNSLQHDGQDHIAELVSFFRDKHAVLFLYLPLWLRGAVAKALDAQQNAMLVLDGPQDIGKSYFVSWLCSPLPQSFVEGPIDPTNKDQLIQLISTWIWEVAELGSTTRRADREALKFFISMRGVTVRKPYGHFDIKKPALASFVGTVNNESGFLSDPTGSRRFLVTTIDDIDWTYSKAIGPDQVWAQAVAEYRAGLPWRLDREQARQAAALNAEYNVTDPIEDLLRELYEIDPAQQPAWWTASADILQTLQDNGWRGQTRQTAMGIAATMRRLGLTKYRFNGRYGFYGIRRKLD